MKPENKIPVLTRLSDEMTAVVNFNNGPSPRPADGDIETQRQYYLLERRFWNADAPSMTTRTCAVPTPYGDVTTGSTRRSRPAGPPYTICTAADLSSVTRIRMTG